MKYPAIVTLACLYAARCVVAADGLPAVPESVPVDPETRHVLEAINAAGAYSVPHLNLKQDSNYAGTSQQFQPFGQFQDKPYARHYLRQLEYTGAGRAVPEPDDVKSVKLGFLGPMTPTVSVATGGTTHDQELGLDMLHGAQMAVDDANAHGGYLRRKIPFELVVHNDNGLWGASGNEIIKMVYQDKVWAILGTIDGANSHIALRVALKAEIFIMNSADTDPTYVETNIPWTARCISDDRQMGYLLVDYIYRKLGLTRIAIIRSSNRYGRFGVREIRDGSRRLGHPVVVERPYELGSDDFTLQLEPVKQADVEAVVHWGNAVEGAKILNQMRAMGLRQLFFGCHRCLSDRFVQIAGQNAEGVVCASPWDPTAKNVHYRRFVSRFRQRYGQDPGTYAAHAYDGMSLLIWAIQVAGLNRAKIRDLVAHRPQPWPGVTGSIPFSAVLDDTGDVFLARRENGAWTYLSRKTLNRPHTQP